MTGVCLAEGLEQLRARGSLRLGGGGGLLLPALLPEQIEQVQLGRGLPQHRGLHAERVVGTENGKSSAKIFADHKNIYRLNCTPPSWGA